jgi:hypothetical protein
MIKRSEFAKKIADLKLDHVGRAIAFLWYYRQTQEYEERLVSELVKDLKDEGFPEPNITRLNESLKKSKYTIKGRQRNTFQLDIRKIPELDKEYNKFLKIKTHKPDDNIIPFDWVKGTRLYLEKLVNQINSTYEFGLYDCCAVMCRRLMESLIIEVYISSKRQHEIQNNKRFHMLEKLITYICADKNVTLGRNSPRAMQATKDIGDTAAHDRTYVTEQVDIDDIKSKYRRLIQELLTLSKIQQQT